MRLKAPDINWPVFWGFAAVILLAGLSVQAAPLPRTGTFFYSTECREAESDDAEGGTVKIVRTASGDMLEFGFSEGPMLGAQATDLHLTPAKTTSIISFTVTPSPELDAKTIWHFTGTVSTTEIRIKNEGISEYAVTPRRPLNYEPPKCR